MPEQIGMAIATQVISHALFDNGSTTSTTEAAAQIQQDRADEMFDLWVNYYQPIELTALQDIAGRALYIPKFGATIQRANAQALQQAADSRKKALYCLPPRCEGMRRFTAAETTRTQARVVSFAMQAAKTAEDAKAYVKEEQRIHDRMLINNIGLNINSRTDTALSAAAALYASAASRAQAAYAASAQQLGGLAKTGLSQYQGYAKEQAQITADQTSAVADSYKYNVDSSAGTNSLLPSVSDAVGVPVADIAAASDAASSVGDFAAIFG